MSDTDSFIDEVTEELRNDRLFRTLRRWAWIGGLAVLAIVVGVAWNEIRKNQIAEEAQSFGDTLLLGVQADDGGETLSGFTSDDPQKTVIANHLAAAAALEAGETERALAALDAAINTEAAPQIYRDLAALKHALALPQDRPIEERRAAFEALSTPGAPFRLIALERLALLTIEAGDRDGAIAQLRDLIDQAGVTAGLQRRATELIVALGGELDEL